MKRLFSRLKSINVVAVANILTVMAVTFAVRSCNGKLYEPEVPKKLQ